MQTSKQATRRKTQATVLFSEIKKTPPDQQTEALIT